jgi:NAD-dependent DNA ligase
MDKKYYYMNKEIIDERNIDEFIGICRGILADDELNSHEKDYIIEWIENHDLHYHDFVGTLYVLLKNNEDLKQSKTLLLDFLGGKPPVKEVKSMSTKLLFDSLVKPIVFRDTKFCLTGKFVSAYGNRKVLEEVIISKGGICKKNVVIDLDYLVIGELGNNDWRHSNFGRKIEAALKIKNRPNSKIKIISEAELLKNL